MLAPVTEAHYGEEQVLALTLASARSYAAFSGELEEAASSSVGYRTCGTLAVAYDGDDRSALDELAAFQRRLGLEVESLTSRECRGLEPMLAPGIRGGIRVAGDHQVDNRRLLAALLIALDRAGVRVVRQRVTQLDLDGDRVVGVRLDDGSTVGAATTVLAAGCWSSTFADVPVRPVKGQILRLHAPEPFVTTNVRALVQGTTIYVVPRADGEIVIGATVEEQGYDATVTAGGVYELLRDARAVLPGVTELPLLETTAALRPGSPDNAPIIGRSAQDGLVVATGHGRNGILLAPVTADAVASLVVDGVVTDVVAPFGPERFAAVTA
jgi:glycine oxidase